MNELEARKILSNVQENQISVDEALKYFQKVPSESLGFAELDLHRGIRQGYPEVVFGEGKTPQHICEIAKTLIAKNDQLLVTRVSKEAASYICENIPEVSYHESARCLTYNYSESSSHPGFVGILTAGTSDIPVAEEAAITVRMMGFGAELKHDLGVAGIHRILNSQDWLRSADVLIVVAGMEGALPSVVAGLTSNPVIAVPTSIGYGAHFQGVAALLGMLNSCGSGVTVVNIDNGFGAGFAAAQIKSLQIKNS